MISFTRTLGCLRPFVALLILLIPHPAAHAQASGGWVAGRVSDAADSKPLEGIRVSIIADGRGVAEASTDSSGTYRILALSPGEYEISFSAGPYRSLAVAAVTVESNRVSPVDVELEKTGPDGNAH